MTEDQELREIQLARSFIQRKYYQIKFQRKASPQLVRTLVIAMEDLLKLFGQKHSPHRKFTRKYILGLILEREVLSTNELYTHEASGILEWLQSDTAKEYVKDVAHRIESENSLFKA